MERRSLPGEEIIRYNVSLGNMETIALPGLGRLLWDHCIDKGLIYAKDKRWMKAQLQATNSSEVWGLLKRRFDETWPLAAEKWRKNHTEFRDLKRALKPVCDLAWLSYAAVLRTRTYFAVMTSARQSVSANVFII